PRRAGYPAFAGYDGEIGAAKISMLQLRLVPLVNHVLAFGLHQPRLVVDQFADARHDRALDPLTSPQFRAHQRLATVEIGFPDVDVQHRAWRLAELDHRRHHVGIGRYLARAADAQRFVDPGHEEDQLHEA